MNEAGLGKKLHSFFALFMPRGIGLKLPNMGPPLSGLLI
jgi:hypothetical protein